MNDVKNLDCTKCFHRKMCKRKIEVCDFVDETKIYIGQSLYDAYYMYIINGIVEGSADADETHIPLGKLNEEDAKRWL